jgi:glycosyltransferase involved in cell wall biosynthesis
MRLKSPDVLFLVPSLRISGGVQEVLLLAEQLTQSGVQVQILSLWKAENELPHRDLPIEYLSNFKTNRSLAAAQYALLLIRFMRYLRRETAKHRPSLMLTHFSTFPFAWMAPSLHWYCFNQDIEWMFVPDGLPRLLLRRLILATGRRADVVTTNSFVESQYAQQGISSVAQVSIWADGFWLSPESHDPRPVDIVMLLRKGGMKRLDLYLQMLSKLEERSGIRCAIVSPDSDILDLVKCRTDISLLRPSNQELRNLYRQSKIFISLSDTEGFGLTPLEAMGQGCIPICRDSGGVRCYMTGSMLSNLVPRSEPLETILTRIDALLENPQERAMLSAVAVKIFHDGLKESQVRRTAAVRSLASILRHD